MKQEPRTEMIFEPNIFPYWRYKDTEPGRFIHPAWCYSLTKNVIRLNIQGEKDLKKTPKFEVIEKPAFKQVSTMEETQLFEFNHSPHLGLLGLTEDRKSVDTLILPTMAFSGFNPSSLEALASVKEGDKIHVISDISTEFWEFWNPPDTLRPLTNVDTILTVSHIIKDSIGFPLILANKNGK